MPETPMTTENNSKKVKDMTNAELESAAFRRYIRKENLEEELKRVSVEIDALKGELNRRWSENKEEKADEGEGEPYPPRPNFPANKTPAETKA